MKTLRLDFSKSRKSNVLGARSSQEADFWPSWRFSAYAGRVRPRFLISQFFSKLLRNICKNCVILAKFGLYCAIILKKNEKSKIGALHALRIPKISNLAKNQLPGAIFLREHSIFVILRNRALKFSFCMETPMFSKIQNKFARERKKLFKFRKKR